MNTRKRLAVAVSQIAADLNANPKFANVGQGSVMPDLRGAIVRLAREQAEPVLQAQRIGTRVLRFLGREGKEEYRKRQEAGSNACAVLKSISHIATGGTMISPYYYGTPQAGIGAKVPRLDGVPRDVSVVVCRDRSKFRGENGAYNAIVRPPEAAGEVDPGTLAVMASIASFLIQLPDRLPGQDVRIQLGEASFRQDPAVLPTA